ncbi:MAG: aldolase [Paracoccus sp. (in: a-proteobacteria)]|nr:aldolase [Paracoccus sp. (in: a-proteobacteria)]
MSAEAKLRETLCDLAASLFSRGLTHGSTGNISARTADGGLLVSPTGSSFGALDPGRLAHFDAQGRQIGGDRPTKEITLHQAFYDTRHGTGAVVHLHSCHSVALSTLPDADPDDFLPPLTPYAIMQLGRVSLLPYFQPGDAAMGDAVRGLDGRRAAVMLANHGPVVAGRTPETACNAIEELEATARLALMLRGLPARMLNEAQIAPLLRAHEIAWES